MFLAADIGNSNIVLALHDGESWIHSFRYESKDEEPTLYYINGLNEILLEWRISVHDIKQTGISSVVPNLNEKISDAIRYVTGKVPHTLGPEDFINLDIHVPLVYEIGSDLVANSYAALKRYDTDCLVVDFGTALTFTVVSKNKGIQGVSIAPGLKTAMLSLSGNTAQLPEVWLTWPESALGHDTESAIRAGVLVGYYGLVKEMKSRILQEFPKIKKVIGTGGLVDAISQLKNEFDETDKFLTLEGIRLIMES